MREFVGIKSALDVLIEVTSNRVPVENVFKREALVFSRVGCPQFLRLFSSLSNIRELGPTLPEQLSNQLAYLQEQGFLFDLSSSTEGPQQHLLEAEDEYRDLKSIELSLEQELIQSFKSAGLDGLIGASHELSVNEMKNYLPKVERVFGPIYLAFQYLVRRISVEQRILHGMDAYPIFSEIIPAIPFQRTVKSDVINVVIKTLPIPDEMVPWEQIIEYRSDPDSQSKFLALRHWMSEVARAALTPAEVEEKLEYLVDQYRQHLQLHRIKAKTGTLEAVVTTSLGAFGNLITFKWDKVAQALFSVKHKREALLEAELTSPGKEVAYIVKVKDKFEGTS